MPGTFICPPTIDYACAPPLVPFTTSAGQHVCVAPCNTPPYTLIAESPSGAIGCIMPPRCAVTFEYVQSDPGTVISPPTPAAGCDQAGLELALAVALAKLMGGK